MILLTIRINSSHFCCFITNQWNYWNMVLNDICWFFRYGFRIEEQNGGKERNWAWRSSSNNSTRTPWCRQVLHVTFLAHIIYPTVQSSPLLLDQVFLHLPITDHSSHGHNPTIHLNKEAFLRSQSIIIPSLLIQDQVSFLRHLAVHESPKPIQWYHLRHRMGQAVSAPRLKATGSWFMHD